MWGRPVAEICKELIERNAYSPELTDQLLEGLEKAGLEGVVDSTSSGSTLAD